MQIQATLKVLGDVSRGTSVSTGNEWLTQKILIEWYDVHRLQRQVVTLWGDQVNHFQAQSPQVGDTVTGDLDLGTERRGTGERAYAVNRAQLHDIVVGDVPAATSDPANS